MTSLSGLISPEYLRIGLLVCLWLVVRKVIGWYFRPRGPNPFEKDDTTIRAEYVIDQKKRDGVIKQGFNIKNVPDKIQCLGKF